MLVKRRKILHLPTVYSANHIQNLLQEAVLFYDILMGKGFVKGSLVGDNLPTTKRAKSI